MVGHSPVVERAGGYCGHVDAAALENAERSDRRGVVLVDPELVGDVDEALGQPFEMRPGLVVRREVSVGDRGREVENAHLRRATQGVVEVSRCSRARQDDAVREPSHRRKASVSPSPRLGGKQVRQVGVLEVGNPSHPTSSPRRVVPGKQGIQTPKSRVCGDLRNLCERGSAARRVNPHDVRSGVKLGMNDLVGQREIRDSR